jgi:hypothetical protein
VPLSLESQVRPQTNRCPCCRPPLRSGHVHALLAGPTALAGPDEVRRGADEQHDRGPHVEAQAERVVQLDGVDAEHLDPTAAQGVAHHVQGQDTAGAEPVPAVEPDDDGEGEHVPDELAEERRVECGEVLEVRTTKSDD